MSDQTNVFEENNSQSTQTIEPSANPFEDQLKGIINGNGEQKYKDVNTALEALKHSQDFIPQLQSEKESLQGKVAELEAQLKAAKSVEESINELNSTSQTQETQTQSSFSEEDINKLLEQKLTSMQQQSLAQSNEQEVNKALVSRYGDKAGEVVRSKAQELGMTVEDMKNNSGTAGQVAANLPSGTKPFNKMSYGLAGEPDILDAIEKTGRKTAVLVGLETDVCVCQSALGLLANGYRVVVLADAVGSPGPCHNHGIERMRNAGVVISSVKGTFYEWQRTVHCGNTKFNDVYQRSQPDGVYL